jgi:hypothetical protein
MSEKMTTPENVKKDVEYCLRAFSPKFKKVEKYKKLAIKLSKKANKIPSWSWRYIESIHRGTMEPSRKFLTALEAYAHPERKPPPVYSRPAFLYAWYRLPKDERYEVIKTYMDGKIKPVISS